MVSTDVESNCVRLKRRKAAAGGWGLGAGLTIEEDIVIEEHEGVIIHD